MHDIHRAPVPGWVGSTSRESPQKTGRGTRRRSGRFSSWLLPRFVSLAVGLYRSPQALPKWLTQMTFSFGNPETAPTSGSFRSTDGSKFAAAGSDLLNCYPFMKMFDLTTLL